MRKLLTLILLVATSCAVAAESNKADSVKVEAAFTAEKIIAEARTHIGKRYLYGSQGPKTFDCSGFTGYVYKAFGYTLSRSSKGQAEDGRKVNTRHLDELQKGDIVLFGGRKDRKSVGHVGIFIETIDDGKDFLFIHADNSGVRISKLSEEYYSKRFLGARRVLPDFNGMSRKDKALLKEKVDSVKDSAKDSVRDSAKDSVRDSVRTVQPDNTDKPARYHTVQEGESLESIALKRKTTVEEICRLNGISPDSVPVKGTRLRVR